MIKNCKKNKNTKKNYKKRPTNRKHFPIFRNIFSVQIFHKLICIWIHSKLSSSGIVDVNQLYPVSPVFTLKICNPKCTCSMCLFKVHFLDKSLQQCGQTTPSTPGWFSRKCLTTSSVGMQHTGHLFSTVFSASLPAPGTTSPSSRTLALTYKCKNTYPIGVTCSSEYTHWWS